MLFLFDVDDAKLADFLNAQTTRTIYMASRAEGVRIVTHVGHSVQEILPVESRALPPA